ncbi:ATP-binding protein [Bradyrhizobium sp. USDA 3315]
MLTHPTHDRLVALGLNGMAKALDEQQRQPDIAARAFEERLALLVDREATERENKRLVARLRFASLRQNAVVEDRHQGAPRARQAAVPKARRRRLDRPASEPAHHPSLAPQRVRVIMPTSLSH